MKRFKTIYHTKLPQSLVYQQHHPIEVGKEYIVEIISNDTYDIYSFDVPIMHTLNFTNNGAAEFSKYFYTEEQMRDFKIDKILK